MRVLGVPPGRHRDWKAIFAVTFALLMLSVPGWATAVKPTRDPTIGPPGPTAEGVDVISIQVTFDHDVVVSTSQNGRAGEALVTGRVSMTGIPPNTQVDVGAEVDKGWATETSPASVNYVMPQTQDSFDFSVWVRVPEGEQAYTEGVLMVTITARSAVLPAKTALGNVVVVVGAYHDLDVVWRTDRVECCRNESFKIKGEVANRGNGDESLAFVIENPFEGVPYIIHYVSAPQCETTEFAVRVDVPDNTSLGVHRLDVYCFVLGFLSAEVVSSQEVEVEVVEGGDGGTWMAVAGIAALVAVLGLAFYLLRRERTRRMTWSAPRPDGRSSNQGS